jgi:hypothetical protein
MPLGVMLFPTGSHAPSYEHVDTAINGIDV